MGELPAAIFYKYFDIRVSCSALLSCLAQIWIAIHHLIMDVDSQRRYNFSEHSKGIMLRVRFYFSYVHWFGREGGGGGGNVEGLNKNIDCHGL